MRVGGICCYSSRIFFGLAVLVGSLSFVHVQDACSQDISALGGDLTSDLPDRNAIQVAAPNVPFGDRRTKQLNGFIQFHKLFTRDEGLGPFFINSGCAECHIDNAKGPVKFSKANRGGSTMVVKASLQGRQENGAPVDVPGLGEQIPDQSTAGSKRKARMSMDWRYIKKRYPDGTQYELRKPKLSYKLNGSNRRRILTSLRMTPPVIGPGLLEAIPDEVILEMSDPFDLDGDGISGHPNYVPNFSTNTFEIGRFGFRASHPTTEQQTVAALFHDIGISTDIIPDESNVAELSSTLLEELVLYQKLAGVPRARNQNDPKVIEGKALFQEIGCNKCHRMTMTTGDYEDPELSYQTFHPFTDLLLHDMGAGLADRRAEFSASGSEWRTTPLWGLGFAAEVIGRGRGRAVYLHDGRARSIEEAILWHGGEGGASRKAFRKLKKAQRSALIAFLRSL